MEFSLFFFSDNPSTRHTFWYIYSSVTSPLYNRDDHRYKELINCLNRIAPWKPLFTDNITIFYKRKIIVKSEWQAITFSFPRRVFILNLIMTFLQSSKFKKTLLELLLLSPCKSFQGWYTQIHRTQDSECNACTWWPPNPSPQSWSNHTCRVQIGR